MLLCGARVRLSRFLPRSSVIARSLWNAERGTAESPRRALLAPFGHDDRASNGVRHVDQWLPVHAWDTAQGMPRLSCRFCVLASRSALVLAARLDPDGARRRADLEDAMGHQFRADVSMREIIAEAAHATGAAPAEDWAA